MAPETSDSFEQLSYWQLFADRQDAGRQLAAQLIRFREDNPVILALPRGGVPVALEVARSLEAPLDLVFVRKIGAPLQPELAVGAVADGDSPVTVLNQHIVDALGIPQSFLDEESAAKLEEIKRRKQLYLGDRKRVALRGRTVIVVDDGIATGATTRAALLAVRRSGASMLVLAVPVAPPDSLERLEADADETVCLHVRDDFPGVGVFYRDFRQVSDFRVAELLKEAPA